MAHTAQQVWGFFDEDVRPHKGMPASLISEDMHRPKDADFAGGYLMQSLGIMPLTSRRREAAGHRGKTG
jgi:hypothetical protein